MSFPSTLTGAVDGVTEIEAAHLNNLEAKVGVDSSAVVSSLDYKLKSASSVDPGHLHTAGALSGGSDGDVIFRDPADSTWKPATPDDAGLVAKTGAQTIAGVKTLSSIPILPGATMNSGTAPVTAPANLAQVWVEDVDSEPGKAGLHMMAESGTGKLIVAGVLIKTDTGDPAQVHEGLLCLNTFDEKLSIYAGGEWREIVTWA